MTPRRKGVFVGRVAPVPLDDGVDPAVLGEIHCWRDLGVGVIWVLVLDWGAIFSNAISKHFPLIETSKLYLE